MDETDHERPMYPGPERVLEDLLAGRGNECWRYRVAVSGARWADVVRLLVEEDVGVPLGYRAAEDGAVRCNPPADARVDAEDLYVLVRKDNVRPDNDIRVLVSRLA